MSMHYRNSLADPPAHSRSACWLGLLLVLMPWGLILACALTACPSPRPPVPAAPPAAHPGEASIDTTPRESGDVAQARKERDEAKRNLAAAESRLQSAEEARDAARLDRLRLISMWVAGIALLGMFAGVALWFLLPVGLKRWAGGGIGACVGVLVAAMVFNAAMPYLAWVVGALVIAGLAWGLWFLAKTLRAGREIAAHGDRLERAITDWVDEKVVDKADLLGVVKTLSTDAQERAGVRNLVAAIRGKPKPTKAAA